MRREVARDQTDAAMTALGQMTHGEHRAAVLVGGDAQQVVEIECVVEQHDRHVLLLEVKHGLHVRMTG